MSSQQAAITREDVARLAGLARIDLSTQEQEQLASELEAILGHVATVSSVVGEDTPATSHPVPLVNVFREDVAKPGLTPEQALSGAPAAEDGRFRVPRILGEEQ